NTKTSICWKSPCSTCLLGRTQLLLRVMTTKYSTVPYAVRIGISYETAIRHRISKHLNCHSVSGVPRLSWVPLMMWCAPRQRLDFSTVGFPKNIGIFHHLRSAI